MRNRPGRSRDLEDKEDSNTESSESYSEVEVSPYVSLYAGSSGCIETVSVRQVGTVCGTHTYSVVGYTLARVMGPGTRLCSDLFEVGGQLFRLEVYPAGMDGHTRKYVSLFLTTPGSMRPSHLLYELSIVDQSQSKPQHITESRTAHEPSPGEAAAVLAPQRGVVAGFPRFIKANFLHRNPRRFLANDTLTIRATVRALTGRSSFPVLPPAQPQVFYLQPNPVHPLQLSSVPLQASYTAAPLPSSYGSPCIVTGAVSDASLYGHPAVACSCGSSCVASPQGGHSSLHSAHAPLAPNHLHHHLHIQHQGQQHHQQQQQLGALALVVPLPSPGPRPSLLPLVQPQSQPAVVGHYALAPGQAVVV